VRDHLEGSGCLIRTISSSEIEAQLLNSVSERHDDQTLARLITSWRKDQPAACVDVIGRAYEVNRARISWVRRGGGRTDYRRDMDQDRKQIGAGARRTYFPVRGAGDMRSAEGYLELPGASRLGVHDDVGHVRLRLADVVLQAACQIVRSG
jgi:hypothetical protein